MKLINQALDAGRELGNSTFASPFIVRLADAPGFEDWYQTVAAVLTDAPANKSGMKDEVKRRFHPPRDQVMIDFVGLS